MAKLFVIKKGQTIMISLKDRINNLIELGLRLRADDEALAEAKIKARQINPWFTAESIDFSIEVIIETMLTAQELYNCTEKYDISDNENPKKVGLVLAGNIPLVGFHDILSVYITGNISIIKLSSKDEVLIDYILNILNEIDEGNKDYFSVVDKLQDYDAIIATGSNNTAIHFKQYFKHVPHIIRRNRNGVAVILGNETREDFIKLGKDIFTYFGLGCRNVSKIYAPNNYDFSLMLRTFDEVYQDVNNHNKYRNNFDYNLALFMLNKEDFLQSGCLLLKRDKSIASRISCVHYEYYDTIHDLKSGLLQNAEEIQCIVSQENLDGLKTYSYGTAQQPSLLDYADGVDTVSFLLSMDS